jgi:hypothetical protein
MSDVIDVLRDQYNATVSQQKDWHFFLFLMDYMAFVRETPALKSIMNLVEKEKHEKIDEMKKAEEKAVLELQEVKKRFLAEIVKRKIKCEGLSEGLSRLKELEAGKINPRHWKSERLGRGITDLIEITLGHAAWTKEYEVIKSSKKYVYRWGLSMLFRERKKNALWGIYDKLNMVSAIAFDSNGVLDKLKKEGKDTEDCEQWINEIELIKNDGKDVTRFSFQFGQDIPFSSSKDKRVKEFKRDDYKFYLERLHFHLLKELAKSLANQTSNDTGGFSFDNKQLEHKGVPIVVAKSKNTNQYFLLELLLENPKRLWNNDEIWEKLFKTPYRASEWKKIYNAAYDLNDKIAKQTGVDDLVERTRTTTRFSPKYLKK